MFWSYFFLILSGVISLLGIIYILQTLWRTLLKKEAPYIPSPLDTAQQLAQHIIIPAKGVVYDLGCGDGRLLRALYNTFPHATYRGIEHELAPYVLFRWHNRNIPKEYLSIKREDFFKTNISSATHVLTYLFPHIMDKLLSKFEKELKPGTLVISVDFAFSKKQPKEIINLETHTTRGKRLYVYEF
ncbi:MAG: class I SAM-dependent methyltransferase [Patescibacteria group bacterium]|nr:class I SAM-dependent methyltransferase [Patescibacteria group bacterium]